MIYFKRTGKQRPNFEGNSGTKTKSGNREHKKTFFIHFGGNRGTSPFISEEQGNRYPTWEGPPPGKGALAGQLCTDV